MILAVALGPALPIGAVLASIGRRTLSPGIIAYAASGGLIAALLSLVGGMFYTVLDFSEGDLAKSLGEAFLGAAVPEEVAKFAVITGFVLRQAEAVARRDAILVGGWVGLGFAIFENFYYVTGANDWLLTGAVRASLSVPGHVSWGLIMGYFIARHARGEGSLLPALVTPILLHGGFDAVLMYQQKVETDPLPSSILFVLAFAVVLLAGWALVRWPVSAFLARLDQEPGAEVAMSEELSRNIVISAGLTCLVLIACLPVAVIAAITAALIVDLRYASLVVLCIMPLTFVDLWRRA